MIDELRRGRTLSGMTHSQQPTTAIIHDSNGTWFTPKGLRVVLLTEAELSDLEAGGTSVLLGAFGGASLDGLLPYAVDDPRIEWAWE